MDKTIHIGDRFGHLIVIDKDKRPVTMQAGFAVATAARKYTATPAG